MARGGYFPGGQADYSGLDRIRAGLMDAVNRHAQNEASYTQAARNELENSAIGNIMSQYQSDIAPQPVMKNIDVPTSVSTTDVPAMPGFPALQVPTGVKETPTPVQTGVKPADDQTQWNAAMNAFSRLAQYGPKGVAIGRELANNLLAYSRMFPFQKPVHTEELLGTTPVRSSLGDESAIAQFGYRDEETGQPVVTSHAVVPFSFPPGYGGGKNGDRFYGTAFTYNDPTDTQMPTGINRDLDQTERMKLENQVNGDETRQMNQLDSQMRQRDSMVSANQQAKLYGLPQKYDDAAINGWNKQIDDTNKQLVRTRRAREVLRGTFKAGQVGGEFQKGSGIIKRGSGH